jgi:hypothetical protein
MLAEEERTWTAFAGALADVDPARRAEPTLTPEGWSVQTAVVHTAAWFDDAARVLTAIADGSWDAATDPAEEPGYADRVNEGHASRAAAMTTSEADASIAAARDRMRAAYAALPAVGEDAWVWWEESGPRHELKHLHDVRAWLAGGKSDPRVGDRLDDESAAWREFAGLLDAAPDPLALGPDGWSARDVMHHLVSWLDHAVGGIERNEGLPAIDVTMDELNARWLAEGASLDPADARAALDEARMRVRLAFASLPAPSADAMRAFVDDTTDHYEEHVEALRSLAAGTA